MTKTIHRRIFKDDKIIGILMGTKVENGVVITASQCALSKGDIFDKEFGKALCVRRVWSFEGEGRIPTITKTMQPHLEGFAARCMRYFRTDNIIYPIVRS